MILNTNKPTRHTYHCHDLEYGFDAPCDLPKPSTRYLNDGGLASSFHVPSGTINYRQAVKLSATRLDGAEVLTGDIRDVG